LHHVANLCGGWRFQVFKSGGCKPKAGSLSIDRKTLDKGRLSCLFDSGTISDGILHMRLHCSDAEEKQPSLYGAQIKLRPDKKIELIMEPNWGSEAATTSLTCIAVPDRAASPPTTCL
jgi:hypothetical protein